jgi:hypothetical protein
MRSAEFAALMVNRELRLPASHDASAFSAGKVAGAHVIWSIFAVNGALTAKYRSAIRQKSFWLSRFVVYEKIGRQILPGKIKRLGKTGAGFVCYRADRIGWDPGSTATPSAICRG